MSSPVARTMAVLRADGYDPWIVQRSIPTRPHPTSIDLFGVVDIEALGQADTRYVQVCRDADLSDHFRTCLHEPLLRRLLAIPTRRFEIWSWAKKRNRWRERRLTAEWTPNGVVFVEHAPVVAPAGSRETVMDVQTCAKRAGR